MTPERWQQIEEIFYRVLEGEPAERARLLDASCGDDLELRREVELLLEAEAKSGSFMVSDKSPGDGDASAAVVERPVAGRRFGQYEVLSAIGAGAMGEVYLARDTRLGRLVAVKVLPGRFTSDRERVARFMQEAKACSALNHPNIVTVHDGGEDQGSWFIATEFIEGVTLRQRLAGGKLPLPEALDIAIQSAVALGAAHAAGVTHRDIKPENIMIRPDGLVKILDFGLARMEGSAFESRPAVTQAGSIMGTPRYMSPEQATGRRAAATSDIFSLGAVLYEMVAGQPAFGGATASDVVAALLTTEPERLSERDRSNPPELDTLLAKAMAKEHTSRYQSMQKLVGDLRELKKQLDARQAPAWRHSRWVLSLAALLVIALLFIGLYWRAPAIGRQSLAAADVVPLTTFAGFKDYPALSPDGRRLAFSWNGGQGGVGGKLERNIYVKPVGTGDPVQLTNSTQDSIWPVWSPDGRQIAFGRRGRDAESTFFVVSSDGGPERKLATGGTGISWSPDGKSIAMTRLPSPAGSGGIFLLDLQTGSQRELTGPAPDYDTFPTYSPDGHWVAFTRGSAEHQRGIWVVPAQGGAAKALKYGEKRIVGLTWTADSRDIVFSTQRDGVGEALWRIPLAGGPPLRVEVTSDSASNPNIPAIGGSMAYTLSFIDTNIYRRSSAGFGGSMTIGPFGAETPIVVSSREDHSPDFSPDGKWITFVSSRSGEPEIWIAHRDGSQASLLTHLQSASLGSPRWSPDSRWIAFDCHKDGNTDIYAIDAHGGNLRRLTTDAAADIMPTWSPDGAWMYFTSERSGMAQVWKVPAGGGAAIQITHGGAREARPSPDGKTIYFTKSRPEASIWSVAADSGSEQALPELKGFDRIARAWGVVQDGLYFISRQDGPRQEIRFFSFVTRKTTTLAVLEKEPIWNVPALALSLDGRELLTVHVDHEVNDLMLVQNFN